MNLWIFVKVVAVFTDVVQLKMKIILVELEIGEKVVVAYAPSATPVKDIGSLPVNTLIQQQQLAS